MVQSTPARPRGLFAVTGVAAAGNSGSICKFPAPAGFCAWLSGKRPISAAMSYVYSKAAKTQTVLPRTS